MNLNEDIKYILNTINKNDFESFVVGGCVRDFLMNEKPKDYDITTSAKPTDIKKLFSKTVDTGIEHGTVTVVLNKENYEVTTYRIDGEYENNRKPKEVFFTTDIVKDLERRDFTMNAIAYSPEKNFIDPFFGQEDIKNKIIRGVGNPAIRFQEDALRMFRALRFSCQLGFEIEKNTFDAILSENFRVKNLSVERVRVEFTKLILSKHLENFNLIVKTKLFFYYSEDKVFHNFLGQNLEFIEEKLPLANADIVSRYSILLLNYSDSVLDYLKFLKFDNKTSKEISEVIKLLREFKTSYDDVDTRIYLSKYGFEILNYAIDIKEKCFYENHSKMKTYIEETKTNNFPLTIKDLKIDGTELKNLGISEGKKIGSTLEFLLQQVLVNPELNNFDTLKKIFLSIN